MIKIVILAIVQGLTEFLPISSSGHLVLASKWLAHDSDLFLYTVLHLGTLGSVFVYFFKDILAYLRDIVQIKKCLLACFITGSIALIFKGFFESLFSAHIFVLGALFFNGLVMFWANRVIDKTKKEEIGYWDASFMGLIQSLAVIPGISRSGSTISALLFRGIEREKAFKFSFIASLPLVAAAFLLELKDLELSSFDITLGLSYGLGLIVAFIVGLAALRLLEYVMKKARFDIFAYYCILISILGYIIIK